jgi:hypothetical protein
MLETVVNSLCPSQVREELDRKKAIADTLVENPEKRQSPLASPDGHGKSVMMSVPARWTFPLLFQ